MALNLFLMPIMLRPWGRTVTHQPALAGQHPVGARLRAWAQACLLACMAAPAWAQPPSPAALALQSSERLQETLPAAALAESALLLSAERMAGQAGQYMQLEGQAELRRHDLVLRADSLRYEAASGTAYASGQVRINRMGDVFEGPALTLQLDTRQGHFESPRFSLLRHGGYGEASRVDFDGPGRTVAHQVRYSTCPRPRAADWEPDWYLSANRIVFDQQTDTGTATGAVLNFQGVPILAAPWISFPLSDQRKSGLLAPTFNLDNVSGVELTLPYYFNLAPNRDATLFPTLMSERGIDLAGEFRYLEPRYAGQVRAAFMPDDRLRDADRWGLSLQHQHLLPSVAGLSNPALRLDLNRVSDDNYWRDFPRTSTSLTSRLLRNDIEISASRGNWAFSAGAYTWQTLQDLDAPIVAPYDRLPSLTASYRSGPFGWAGTEGWSVSLLTDVTQFRTDRQPLIGAFNQRTDVNGTRWLGVLNVDKTWQSPSGYLRPGLQLHARQYQLEQAVGPLGARERSPGLLVPTLTLDSGLVLERDAVYFGRAVLQTLEPRLFVAHTPYRRQGYLPVYDSSAFDFNLSSIFAANPFGGHDRIADLSAVTLGATTRLLDPATGTEWANLSLAQRLRLRDQEVVLPGQRAIREQLSDVLLSGSFNWSPQWAFNGTLQYNPELGQTERTTLAARFSPGDFRVLSVAYRLQRDTSEQIDFGWQWPLSDLLRGPAIPALGPGRGLGPGHWYSVGRINYSFTERRIVDLIAGFEYDAGCWIGRIVVERLQQSRTQANQRIMFQLEFTGFARIGTNPLQALQDNIPRYQLLRQQINPPSRFQRHE
ncbi:MAG: LPS assembly protein LptD [Serpentinimonas sp.]|nr:LPS assembly protein LptD [Serpentinimonas sp.]